MYNTCFPEFSCQLQLLWITCINSKDKETEKGTNCSLTKLNHMCLVSSSSSVSRLCKQSTNAVQQFIVTHIHLCARLWAAALMCMSTLTYAYSVYTLHKWSEWLLAKELQSLLAYGEDSVKAGGKTGLIKVVCVWVKKTRVCKRLVSRLPYLFVFWDREAPLGTGFLPSRPTSVSVCVFVHVHYSQLLDKNMFNVLVLIMMNC